MKYRAIIKKSDNWRIGWLVDLPGVNAKERTKAEVIKSLSIVEFLPSENHGNESRKILFPLIKLK